jgi:hypothetical protein
MLHPQYGADFFCPHCLAYEGRRVFMTRDVVPTTPPSAPSLLVLSSATLAALQGRPRRAAHLPAAQAPGALAARLAAMRPRAVMLCPFDAEVDLEAILAALSQAGHAGRVLLVCPPLPDARLVLREIAAMAPGLRLRLVMLPALAG